MVREAIGALTLASLVVEAVLFACFLPERAPVRLAGTWASGDRRIVVTGPNVGVWDSQAFRAEGPRGNRFCLHIPPNADDCMIINVYSDSILVFTGVPTVDRPYGGELAVYRPSR
jgi:hypothetical protein